MLVYFNLFTTKTKQTNENTLLRLIDIFNDLMNMRSKREKTI